MASVVCLIQVEVFLGLGVARYIVITPWTLQDQVVRICILLHVPFAGSHLSMVAQVWAWRQAPAWCRVRTTVSGQGVAQGQGWVAVLLPSSHAAAPTVNAKLQLTFVTFPLPVRPFDVCLVWHFLTLCFAQ